jgi:Ras-related protein Rab-5C
MAAASVAGGTPAKKYKLVLLGDSGVGKSCLVVRLCKDEYVQSLHSTVGSSFFKYSVNLDDPASSVGSVASEPGAAAAQWASSGPGGANMVHFDIWDTAGQERFKSLARMYYRAAAAILVVYDVTSVESFERAKLWVKELLATENGVITLVGNKTDLPDKAVPTHEAAAFAAEAGIEHAEASAKTGEGVKNIFHRVAVKLAKTASAAPVSIGGVRVPGGGAVAAPNKDSKCPC